MPLLCQLTKADTLTEEGFGEVFSYRERLVATASLNPTSAAPKRASENG